MLARLAGVSSSTVRRAERGEGGLTLWTVHRIGEVLGVTAAWLVMGDQS